MQIAKLKCNAAADDAERLCGSPKAWLWDEKASMIARNGAKQEYSIGNVERAGWLGDQSRRLLK